MRIGSLCLAVFLAACSAHPTDEEGRACDSQAPCSQDRVCVDGTCQSPGTRGDASVQDAGTDASLDAGNGQDAGIDGSVDAGNLQDAGTDASLDAGNGQDAEIDAGSQDGGNGQDAGTDAGSQDCGTDAGQDAGADAGDHDALKAGSVLILHMDEGAWDGTANEVVDSSGLGNHGRSLGANTTEGGKFGRAGLFWPASR